MKILTTPRFSKKIPFVNTSVKKALSKFIERAKSSDSSQLTELLKTSHFVEDNIYVLRLHDIRLFYTIEKDERNNIVILLLDLIQEGFTPTRITNRNPRINDSINPYVNSSINPNVNSSINPNVNSSINPNVNSSINPNVNSSINPNVNSSINPNVNSSINPNVNSSINPNVNSSINPNMNPSFNGFYVYDLRLNSIEYIIRVNDNVLMFFDFHGSNTKFAVRHSSKGYVVFNRRNNEWIAHMESDCSTGFNLFSPDNEWNGIIK